MSNERIALEEIPIDMDKEEDTLLHKVKHAIFNMDRIGLAAVLTAILACIIIADWIRIKYLLF